MATATLSFYLLGTLLQARGHALLQLWDGIASASDWTARADWALRGGWDRHGKPARHQYDTLPALLRPDRALLDNAQAYLDQTPSAVDGALTEQGRDDDTITLAGPAGSVRIAVRRLYHDALVQDGDVLLPAYCPGRGAYVLVVRAVAGRWTAMAAIKAADVSPPATGADGRGRLPEIRCMQSA